MTWHDDDDLSSASGKLIIPGDPLYMKRYLSADVPDSIDIVRHCLDRPSSAYKHQPGHPQYSPEQLKDSLHYETAVSLDKFVRDQVEFAKQHAEDKTKQAKSYLRYARSAVRQFTGTLIADCDYTGSFIMRIANHYGHLLQEGYDAIKPYDETPVTPDIAMAALRGERNGGTA
jgi:hypothetical protein